MYGEYLISLTPQKKIWHNNPVSGRFGKYSLHDFKISNIKCFKVSRILNRKAAIVLFRSWFLFSQQLGDNYWLHGVSFFCKKNIQNTYIIFLCCFFFKKSCKNDSFFQSKTNFQKMPHTTSRTLHTSRKSPVSYIFSSLFSFLGNRVFSQTCCLFLFHGFLFVVG